MSAAPGPGVADAANAAERMLRVRGLRVAFGRAAPVVAGVSFDLAPGECVALVGESGSGKSVTARSVLGLTGSGARVTAEELSLRGGHETVELLRASEGRLRRIRGGRIGYVSQAALNALDPLRPIGREIADALRLHTRMPGPARHERVLEVLREVGMPEPELRATQRPHELSGGLRQRAVIASVLALRPDFVIADEPTTALDATVQAGILELLETVRASGAGLLLISHDLGQVARLADRVLVMRRGAVVESGATGELLAAPKHPYTRELIAAVPRGPRPSGLALGGTATSGDGAAEASPAPPPVLTAAGLTRRFGARTAVDGVDLELRPGRTLGLVGESGSGKTTIGRMLLALDAPDAGSVDFDGTRWNPAPERERRERRGRIGAVYQDALSSFDPRLTVGRILADAAGERRSRASDDRPAGDRVAELLGQVGLPGEIAARRPRSLSGGQQQRVAIARAIAPRPSVLVLDEPVSSLDVSVQARILDLLDELQTRHRLSYLFITHDLAVVRRMSDELLVMRAGRIVERGPSERVITEPTHDYTRSLVAAGLPWPPAHPVEH